MDFERIYCAKCGDPIGFWPESFSGKEGPRNVRLLASLRCFGKGRHTAHHEITEPIKARFVEKFTLYYPETWWLSRKGYRFSGLPFLPFLLIAILFGVKKEKHEHYKKIYIGGKLLVWTPLAPNFYTRRYWKAVQRMLREARRISP